MHLSRAINAVRNNLLRRTGSSLAFSASQIATVAAIRNFWLAVPACTILDAAAVVGNVERETSFDIHANGDKNKNGEYEAHGISQWHDARREMIYKYKSIDILTADLDGQLEAMLWEISTPPSWYAHVLNKMHLSTTLEGKITVLVRDYEQSGSQARDVANQMTFATYWLGQWGYDVNGNQVSS